MERGDGRMTTARELGFLGVHGDATDEDVLKLAGVGRARALATVLPDDAANVFITLSARSLNRELTIIARGEAASTEGKLIQAGADRVVLPTRIGAERMAELLLYQDVAKVLSGIKAGDLDRLGRDLRRLGLESRLSPPRPGARASGQPLVRWRVRPGRVSCRRAGTSKRRRLAPAGGGYCDPGRRRRRNRRQARPRPDRRVRLRAAGCGLICG